MPKQPKPLIISPAESGIRVLTPPVVSATLGSGLKSFADQNTRSDNRLVIPYSEIPHFPAPRKHVAGHDGKLIVAPTGVGDTTMAIWSGRIHYYQDVLRRGEKITDLDVKRAAIGFYIAVCRALGVSDVVTSNAVGAVWPDKYQVGNVVRVTDHILDPDEDFGVPPDERWFADKKRRILVMILGGRIIFTARQIFIRRKSAPLRNKLPPSLA